MGLAVCTGVALTACGGSSTGKCVGRESSADDRLRAIHFDTGSDNSSDGHRHHHIRAPDHSGACRHHDWGLRKLRHPSVEPSEIVLACADDGALSQGLHWTNWTAAGASAVGTLVYNDCVPTALPVTITASLPPQSR